MQMNLYNFKKVCENLPKFLNYVESIVLNPLKEKIMMARITRIIDFGNITTNKVEYYHSRLKQYLHDKFTLGDSFTTWYPSFLEHVDTQFSDIKIHICYGM